jgi:hypothetical protein
MVKDPKQIKKLLKELFIIRGKVIVLPTGVVNVDGTVDLHPGVTLPDHRLPIKFGHVTGSFSFNSYAPLTTLVGSPDWVGHTFDCALTHVGSLVGAPHRVDGEVDVRYCELTNFVGGPQQVGRNYRGRRNQITSLEGLPDHIPGELDFELTPGLPILRSVAAEKVEAMQGVMAINVVNDIMNEYVGQGKAGALKAAVELIKAGFKEHARW